MAILFLLTYFLPETKFFPLVREMGRGKVFVLFLPFVLQKILYFITSSSSQHSSFSSFSTIFLRWIKLKFIICNAKPGEHSGRKVYSKRVRERGRQTRDIGRERGANRERERECPSLSVCLSISLSPSVSLSLVSISPLCLSLTLCHPVYLSLFLSMSVSLCHSW